MPAQAEVQQVTIDGQDRPARPEKGELRLTVPAGRHTLEVRWEQSRGMGVVYGVPRVSFSSPAVNVAQQLTIPPERWLLATRGPAWGPAVLFWPYLVFLLAVAVCLGRIPISPLTSTQWVLLGLGLSVLPAIGPWSWPPSSSSSRSAASDRHRTRSPSALQILSAVTVVIFISSMRPTHQVLSKEKNRELGAVRGLILRASRDLMRNLEQNQDISQAASEINALAVYEQRLLAARTWTYNTSMLRTLFFSVLIPLGSLLVKEAVEFLTGG